jgi:alpha-D-ribose 1-methylphosphonate 5-triphosphate synthase subunit PhnG
MSDPQTAATHAEPAPPAHAARQAWLGLLARAPAARLRALCDAALPERPAFSWLRAPEIGTVMVRGRAGGTGAAFNLGEITVTRAALTLADGAVGHGYLQGRDKSAAEAVALIDALMQTEAAPRLQSAILDVLAAEEADRRQTRAEKAAATEVEFFTMTRGDDQ